MVKRYITFALNSRRFWSWHISTIIQSWQHWFWCNTYLILIKAQLNQFSHGTALCKWKKMFLCPLVVDKCTKLKASSWHVRLLWGGRSKEDFLESFHVCIYLLWEKKRDLLTSIQHVFDLFVYSSLLFLGTCIKLPLSSLLDYYVCR